MELDFFPCNKSFKTNPLLVPAVVGRTRRSTSKLPPESFTFGCKSDTANTLTAAEGI